MKNKRCYLNNTDICYNYAKLGDALWFLKDMEIYRWLMIIDSPVLCDPCYWTLVMSWRMRGLMLGSWSWRRPRSRDVKSVWAPQIEAVWSSGAAKMLKEARNEIPLAIKLHSNCDTLFVWWKRVATQISSTLGGGPMIKIKVFQISFDVTNDNGYQLFNDYCKSNPKNDVYDMLSFSDR